MILDDFLKLPSFDFLGVFANLGVADQSIGVGLQIYFLFTQELVSAKVNLQDLQITFPVRGLRIVKRKPYR